MTIERAPANPHMQNDWPNARHWYWTIHRGKRTMTGYFSQGEAHRREPTLSDILGCLADEASSIDNSTTFEDWTRDMGYDTDSRRAEQTWNTINRQTRSLCRMLGDDDYQQLLYNTERER